MTAGQAALDSNPGPYNLVTMPGPSPGPAPWTSGPEVNHTMTSDQPEVTYIYKEVTCCHCGVSHQCCQPLQNYDTVSLKLILS